MSATEQTSPTGTRAEAGARGAPRLVAAVADTVLVGAAMAAFAFTASLAVVLAAMTAGGGELPAPPGEMVLYVSFAMFEMLAMTPLSYVVLSMGSGLWVLLWASRRRIVRFRSPGMVIAGVGRRSVT